MNPIDKAIDALEGSIKLIGREVISNVMPKEQSANYEAIQALRDMQEVDVESLKKKSSLEGRMMFSSAYMNGWNECVNHLSHDHHLIRKEEE